MSSWIYFIGGPSAAGKSTVAAAVAQEHDLNVITLDDFHNVLREHGLTGEPLKDATREISRRLVVELANSGARCVVEGSWVSSELAFILRNQAAFHPVFIGYPRADPRARLAQLWSNKSNGAAHWLSSQKDVDALQFLTSQVNDSALFRADCERLKIDFFDFTDFDAGTARLKSHFASLYSHG